jgi:hypothetical protein
MDLAADPTSLLAFPGFALITFFGANMMKRQRDTDKQQRDFAQSQLETAKASVEIALTQGATVARQEELSRENEQLRGELRGCKDERDRLLRER